MNEDITPEIKLPGNALTEDQGYTVELGGQLFTQAQWEIVQAWARGWMMGRVREDVSRAQEAVAQFHEAMGQPVGKEAHPLPHDRIAVRVELIREEFEDELIPALYKGDLVETVDACIDILYVTYGLLVEMGVNATPVFEEVQGSNMSKLGADGKAIIAGPNDPDGIFEGRVKKGPNYYRPNIRRILEAGEANLG